MLGISRLKSTPRYPAAAYGPDEVVFERLVCARTGAQPYRIEIKTGVFADNLADEYGQFVLFEINGVEIRKAQLSTWPTRESAIAASEALGRRLVRFVGAEA